MIGLNQQLVLPKAHVDMVLDQIIISFRLSRMYWRPLVAIHGPTTRGPTTRGPHTRGPHTRGIYTRGLHTHFTKLHLTIAKIARLILSNPLSINRHVFAPVDIIWTTSRVSHVPPTRNRQQSALRIFPPVNVPRGFMAQTGFVNHVGTRRPQTVLVPRTVLLVNVLPDTRGRMATVSNVRQTNTKTKTDSRLARHVHWVHLRRPTVLRILHSALKHAMMGK